MFWCWWFLWRNLMKMNVVTWCDEILWCCYEKLWWKMWWYFFNDINPRKYVLYIFSPGQCSPQFYQVFFVIRCVTAPTPFASLLVSLRSLPSLCLVVWLWLVLLRLVLLCFVSFSCLCRSGVSPPLLPCFLCPDPLFVSPLLWSRALSHPFLSVAPFFGVPGFGACLSLPLPALLGVSACFGCCCCCSLTRWAR